MHTLLSPATTKKNLFYVHEAMIVGFLMLTHEHWDGPSIHHFEE